MKAYLRWLLPLVAALIAWTAHAGNISVMPVVVGLMAQKAREAITVINQGDERITTQVDVVSWTQAGGEDVFTPTSDVIFNPGVFTLEPGQSQVLRLGWKGSAPIDIERTYRAFLREVPPPPQPKSSLPPSMAGPAQVKGLLELRIPIYVAPQKVVYQPEWKARRLNAETVEVRLSNQGNVRTVVHGMELSTSTDQSVVGRLDVNAAVLAGQERLWLIPIKASVSSELTLKVLADQDRQRLSVVP